MHEVFQHTCNRNITFKPKCAHKHVHLMSESEFIQTVVKECPIKYAADIKHIIKDLDKVTLGLYLV